MSNTEYDDINLIKSTLSLYINGRSLYIAMSKDEEDCKGMHSEIIQQIVEDAKIVCENVKDINKYLYVIHRDTIRYATMIGQNVSIDWFSDINTKRLSIENYEKILRFFEIYEYNQEHLGLFIEVGTDVIWKFDGNVWVDELKGYRAVMCVDWIRTPKDMENLRSPIAITVEDKERRFKPMIKEYE